MSQKSFNAWAGFVFLIITIVHLLRIIKGWDVTIDEFAIPMWASWIAVVIGACLSWHGLFSKK